MTGEVDLSVGLAVNLGRLRMRGLEFGVANGFGYQSSVAATRSFEGVAFGVDQFWTLINA